MELSDVLRRLKIAGFGIFGVLLFGTLGYVIICDASLFDAFYMTSITITTIGFNEVIDLSKSNGGRLFTIVLAFSGIGVFTYLLSNVAALFIEGDIRKTFYKRNMEQKIAKMEHHYIICGCGRVGRNIANELHQTGREFIMADIDPERLEVMEDEVKADRYLSGDCTNDDFIKTLGIERARGIFITTGEDNTNLVICLTARQLNPRIKIIVRNKDITHTSKMKRAGANKIVSPNYIGGLRMASEMFRPTVTSFLDDLMRDSSMNLRVEEVEIGASYDGKTIEELDLDHYDQTMILAIKEGNNWVYKPKKDFPVKKGSLLVLMTTVKERKLIEKLLA